MVFDILAIEVLVPEARAPLAIPARVALKFTEPRVLSHETLSFASTPPLGDGFNILLRWHVLIVVVLVRATQHAGKKDTMDKHEKLYRLCASPDHRATPTARRR